jgi:molybdenum cofactor guanylyltransferase
MLLIGSQARSVGKTELACEVLRKHAPLQEITAVKVTVIREGGGPCPRGGAGCGACSSVEGPWCISEEVDPPPAKDTARMRDSGARKVYWLRVKADHVREGFRALCERLPAEAAIVAESNSLAQTLEPGLFLMVKDKGSRRVKPHVRQVLRYVDRYVVSDGARFDLDPGDLAIGPEGWVLREPAAAILAGGASARMGRDKCLLPLDGRPMVEHIAQQLHSRFRRVLLSTNHPQRYAFLDLRAVPDEEPGQGPLMGIASVLAASRSDTLFVTACDIPTIDGDLVTRLLAQAAHHDCVVPVTEAGIEPLFAVYRQSALPEMRRLLAQGERRVRALFSRVDTGLVDLHRADWYWNLNTEQDYRRYVSHLGVSRRPPDGAPRRP